MYLQCKRVKGVMVVKGWAKTKPSKKHDFVTANIDVDPKDLSWVLGEFVGEDKAGGKGRYVQKWYLHLDDAGNVIGMKPYRFEGEICPVPAKIGAYVTGGIELTNADRAHELVYKGTLEDGSTDGVCEWLE